MNKRYIYCDYCWGEIDEGNDVYYRYHACGCECYCSTECLTEDNITYYTSPLTDKFIEDNDYSWEINKGEKKNE